jgi:ABC-type multidrug transport system fused ATPase/permease subunit
MLCRMYLQAVLRQNVAFFDRLGAGEVTNRVSNDAELIREGISDKVRLTAGILTFRSESLFNPSVASSPHSL